MLRKFLIALAALALVAAPAAAQQSRGFVADPTGTATIFCIGSNTTMALPGSGPIVLVQNTGLSEAFVALGSSTVVASTSSTSTPSNGTPVLPGTAVFLTNPQATTIACTVAAGGVNLRVTTGAGSPIAAAGVNSSTATPAAGTAGAGYPPGATPVTAFASGTTAGTTATLAAAVGKFTYLCGLHAEVGSATAAIPINVTASGLLGGTFTSSANAPVTAATATAGPIISQVFTPCVPSSAVNTAIAVAAGALGAGGVNQNVNAWGFQQ